MILNEPPKSAYDLSFNMFGFPVRVHPGFFILPVVFGASWVGQAENPGVMILIFIMVFFVSILVHELGHSIAFRYFGIPSRICLYWLGGLAIPETSSWGAPSRLNPNQHIIVSLAGPFAGFVLGALVVGIVLALGGNLEFAWSGMFPMLIPNMSGTAVAGNIPVITLLYIGIFCNIVWGLLNLAPVLPLDGGQVCEQLCIKANYSTGLATALKISVVTGGVIAFLGFAFKDTFVGILFALLAISAWMTLQQMMGRSQGRW